MAQQQDRFRHPLARARGLGSAKDGTHHFWVQRVSAVALGLLSVAFLALVLRLVGAPYEEARAILGHPVWAGVGVLLVVALYWHLQLGMQVVIEDYVHRTGPKLALQLLVTFGCIALGLATVFAFLSLAFFG